MASRVLCTTNSSLVDTQRVSNLRLSLATAFSKLPQCMGSTKPIVVIHKVPGHSNARITGPLYYVYAMTIYYLRNPQAYPGTLTQAIVHANTAKEAITLSQETGQWSHPPQVSVVGEAGCLAFESQP